MVSMRRLLATKRRTGGFGVRRVAWREKSGTYEVIRTTDYVLKAYLLQ